MRVCFDGLCFASKRPAVDEDIQSVLYGPPSNHLNQQLTASDSALNHPKSINRSENFTQNNKESSVIESIVEGEILNKSKETFVKMENQNHSIMDIQNNQLVVNNSDFGNNNLLVKSGIGNLANVYISDNIINLTPKEQEFVRIIREKDQTIKELQDSLRRKNDEVANLKSHLDKFQSVFPFSRSPARKTGAGNGQRQRAQGISAEPQSESSIMQMISMRFPKYDKEER